MKKNNKFISFITKYPVIIALVLTVPLIVNVGRYIFKEETIFYNDFYEGEELDMILSLRLPVSKRLVKSLKHHLTIPIKERLAIKINMWSV